MTIGHSSESPAATGLSPSRSGARPARTRKPLSDNAYGYLFLAPWLVGLLVFLAGPTLVSLYLSFTDFNLLQPPKWVGAQNYITLFSRDPRYLQALRVTFTYVFTAAPLNLLFALLLALLLNTRIRGISLYRAVYYVPSLLGGSVAIAILWQQIFGLDGVVSQILGFFGVHGSSWVSSPKQALWTLVILHVWQFGSAMIIFLAGLKQIPAELYEAATIDGAGKVHRFWFITLPMLTPVIFFNLVLQIINSFQAFTPAFIISGGKGGPLDSTLFYTLYVYIQGFTNFRMGYASAMGWILLIIIGVFTALAFLSSKYWVHYDDAR
ncbi:carbohydrate ABC transporter membrane protein 1, CUT1 family [Kaistia soli DSM 19436]|uniref:Carbohydrate ABC transporter membrane protein 1, CUT1 family n=1 Tax=Kaistia soli DSM 19436 TaxID=1122133 RepID=A0A1M5GD48_9HYPH|nr:sugar ABC transporter permease [Kaistia soli]SHG01616.1 carbohydrate ABC transporter membrane protein 1, CUT1 family [Kaistia soli DSM 19436]